METGKSVSARNRKLTERKFFITGYYNVWRKYIGDGVTISMKR